LGSMTVGLSSRKHAVRWALIGVCLGSAMDGIGIRDWRIWD
jgi:hypothetical protein